MRKEIFNELSDEISMSILFKLYKKRRPLSIHDFNHKFSIYQYKKAIQRLRSHLILKTVKKQQKNYYSIDLRYFNLVGKFLQFYDEFNDMNNKIIGRTPTAHDYDKTFTFLCNIQNWAFTGPSALLYYVPFLNLSISKHFICVRSGKEKKKILKEISDPIIDIKVLPIYFMKPKKIISKNNVAILSPDVLFSQLLDSNNARIRLAAIFLISYLTSDILLAQVNKNKEKLRTITYLLFALKEFERNNPKSFLLNNWFWNIDHLDEFKFMDMYISYLQRPNKKIKKLKNNQSLTFNYLRYHWKAKNRHLDKWDCLVQFFNEEDNKLNGSSLESLINPTYGVIDTKL